MVGLKREREKRKRCEQERATAEREMALLTTKDGQSFSCEPS